MWPWPDNYRIPSKPAYVGLTSARHVLRRHYVVYQVAISARRVADVTNCRHSNLLNVELSLLSRWWPMKCTNELTRKAVVMSKFYVIIFSPSCNVRSTRHNSDSTAFEVPVNSSQRGVSAAGQLVIRFWAVTSWPCDELTGTLQHSALYRFGRFAVPVSRGPYPGIAPGG